MKQLPHNFPSTGISKKRSAYLCVFLNILINITKSEQILHISGNVESTKNTDPWEMRGLVVVFDYHLENFTSKIRLTNN